MPKPETPRLAQAASERPDDAPVRRKPVFFRSSGFVDTPVYARDRLVAGQRIVGPALVEEHASTTVVQDGDC